METEVIAIVIVALLVGVSIVGGRIGVSAPLLLVLVGIGVGYLPFVPLLELDPEIILIGVLPPLLYAAAVNVPLIDFKRNFRPVIGLSVLLVVISSVVIGVALHLVMPSVPLPVAIALGAVVSPTDAVAATSIGKRLGMPERVVTILEGESLVNDATSLVLLKTAIAAVAGSFWVWGAVGSFSYSVAAAAVVGLIIGAITVWVRSRLSNPVYDTMLSFTVPFLAFIPAEAIGASGVISVVVTGLYTGHFAPSRFSAIARQNERLNWRTIQFILENGVFLLMGLQLHALVDQVVHVEFTLNHVFLISLLLVTVLIVCRAVFVTPLILDMRRAGRRHARRNEGLTKLAHRVREADGPDGERLRRVKLLAQQTRASIAHEQEQQLSWRDGVVLSWSGMRGVVTLAAVQTLPENVPYRAQLILIAFLVAVTTLLLHGLTLPRLIRKLWPAGAGIGNEQAELTALGHDLAEAADEALDNALQNDSTDLLNPAQDAHLLEAQELAIRRARDAAHVTVHELTTAAAPEHLTGPGGPLHTFKRLSAIALDAQRETLLEERAIGRYSSAALQHAEFALDAQEARLHPPEGNAG